MSNSTFTSHTSWTVNPYPWQEAQGLADSLGLPMVAAMVLAGRGITDPDGARIFLECASPLPDPFLFAHMEPAVQTLSAAIDAGSRIVVHGDYDADGITATALMLLGLRELGVDAEWYLPSRFNEGYGLSRTAVETIAAAGPAVLITVDCGVNYPEEVALGKTLGLEVIVVDHHQPGPELPQCHLIHEAVGRYPSGDLCGVGLALKVMHALYVHREGAARDVLPAPLYKLLDLVAIGTIADLAPLRGENRYYVREGLKLVGIGQRAGLRALATVAACTGVVDSGTVAYRLAPRLNAAGRLADPSPPLRLLLTEDEVEAAALAAKLHELNGARQDVERQILDEAVAQVEALSELPAALVLAAPLWHEGVVGIVASRLVERYHRPTILLGVREGVAKGSGRSIGAYDLMAALNAGAHLLTVYGGHKQAVGLTLDAQKVEEFREAIEHHAGAALDPRDLIPTYHADAVLRGEDVNADTALALASLGPFGTGNPRPRMLLVDACIDQVEATRNGAHLRCVVEVDGVRARGIGFGLGEAVAATREEGCGRALGVQFRVDEWQGSLRPEFQIERIGSSRGGSGQPRECCITCEHAALPEQVGEVRSEPLSGTESVTVPLPPARDLRDRRDGMSTIAQVLASGQRTVLVASSAPSTLATVRERIPLDALTQGTVACVGRACTKYGAERAAASRVSVVEWDVAAEVVGRMDTATHLIVVDPAFRRPHVAFLHKVAKAGAIIHLCYGDDGRRNTSRLLRYQVHPRFAMVCLFRAMQDGPQEEEGLFRRAGQIAWEEAHVVLTFADCARAAAILAELGIERCSRGEDKLEARSIPAYAAAEADYEECSRLCLTM